MPKVKKNRMSVAIDMTPLVDVAFLLLTFFMLTTKFRPQEDVTVNLPASHAKAKIPESNVITITFSPEGKIYFGVDSQQLRGQLFGESRKLKPSIPVTIEELPDLAQAARSTNPKMRVIIKGDKDGVYGPAEDVMNALQKAGIAKFELVTQTERN
jgi:biopolymer transport protein ExbD